MSGKCKGSFAQVRRINIDEFGVRKRLLILRHPECDCNTGCRRVTLWHPRPEGIESTDDWVIKAIARVRWGDGCGGPEAEIDWKHGVILDLSGCYDEVALEIIETRGTLPDEDNLLTYGVLSACCGAGAARGCATRTTARFTVATTENSGLIPIPPFAYAVQFASPTPETMFAAGTGFFQTGSGSVVGSILVASAGDQVPDPWPIVNGAESIIVINNSGAEAIFEAVFLIGV